MTLAPIADRAAELLRTASPRTAAGLAETIGCRVGQLVAALDADGRFRRIAGAGCWDWTLDFMAWRPRVMLAKPAAVETAALRQNAAFDAAQAARAEAAPPPPPEPDEREVALRTLDRIIPGGSWGIGVSVLAARAAMTVDQAHELLRGYPDLYEREERFGVTFWRKRAAAKVTAGPTA